MRVDYVYRRKGMVKHLSYRKVIVSCSMVLALVLSACGSYDRTSAVDETSYQSETLQAEDSVVKENESTSAEETTDLNHSGNSTQTDYIFPCSDTEFIDFEEATSKTDEELRIGRNEIYARHGRKFDDVELQAYFDNKDWYQGTTSPEEFDESILSLEEKRNIKNLSDLEGQRDLLSSKQSYRYNYDSTLYENGYGPQRENFPDKNGEYIIVTPKDFDHISVESHTFWGDKTIEFVRVGFDFEGAINYNNESAGNYKDGFMELDKSEISVLIDGNDCIEYYTR